MAHKFDPANKSKLDNEWRREHLPPAETLQTLGLSATDTVADIGCGIGYFSIPAAEMLHKPNKVFALDTSDEMLDEVEARSAAARLTNLITVQTAEYDLVLPDGMITFALLVNVLHEVEDRKKFIGEIKRILKQAGKLAIIEWEKKSMETGPSDSHRIAAGELIQWMESCGFSLENEMKFTDMFYGLVFRKDE